MVGSLRGRALALLVAGVAAAGAAGCTVVKPVVCAFTYPVDKMAESLATPRDASEDYADIPPTLVLVTAPILIPLRFLTLSVMGVAGGLVSGFASDLNVIVWNVDTPVTNLTRPFKTNAKKPPE
jgi:hypothetical protein